jgi:hypothetical protein
MGAWAEFVGRPYVWQAWSHLLQSVKNRSERLQQPARHIRWRYRAEHPEESAIFDRAMTALAANAVERLVKAYNIARFRHVADIGGGQGQAIAGILFANTALRGTLFDQPHVVEKARTLLSKAGVDDRCDILAGNFLESAPISCA